MKQDLDRLTSGQLGRDFRAVRVHDGLGVLLLGGSGRDGRRLMRTVDHGMPVAAGLYRSFGRRSRRV